MTRDEVLELLAEVAEDPDASPAMLAPIGRARGFLPGLADLEDARRFSAHRVLADRMIAGAPPPLHRRGLDAARALLLAVERGWIVLKGGQLGPLRDPLPDELAEVLDVGGTAEDRAMSLAALLEQHGQVDEVYADDAELAELVREFDRVG
jgi:hypothetical protein